VMWHDIFALIVAGLFFGGVLFTQFRLVIEKVLQLFKIKK